MPGAARPPAWKPDARKRCAWCLGSALYVRYHDEEWGVPVHDDRVLFEYLILEGAQAGLSWSTILNKRANYRRAFDGMPGARWRCASVTAAWMPTCGGSWTAAPSGIAGGA
jgi:Methyladenine glycosylase